ncbi:unnamed protein product, partial [marine sediment metagenome]
FLELVKSEGIKRYKEKDPGIETKVVNLIKKGSIFKDAKDIRKVPF